MEKEKKAKLPKKVALDLTTITEEEDFVRAMWETIGLPERMEEDWNALRTAVLSGGRLPRRMEAKGWTQFQKKCPQGVKKLWKLLDDYADRDDHLKCKFVNLEGASDVVLWAPDLLLVGTLPVQVLSLYVLFFQPENWKCALIGLVLSAVLLAQAVILGCAVSGAQARWHVTRRRKSVSLWRLALCALMLAVTVGVLCFFSSKGGVVTMAMWLAVAASAVAFVGKGIYTVIFLWKTR